MLNGPHGVLLEKSRLVFVLHVGTELDLCLNSSKLAGLVKGHRVGAVENVIPRLKHGQETEDGVVECECECNKSYYSCHGDDGCCYCRWLLRCSGWSLGSC